jgi:hypothetical protein
MKRNVIVFGLISGLMVSAWMLCGVYLCYNSRGSFEGNMLLGYASMILAFSLVFVAVKNYRDKYNNGVISFGKAFKLGFYIALIASTMYVLVWLVDYYLFVPDFMDKYSAHIISQAKSSGKSAGEIADQIKEMSSMKEMYKSPIMVILITYMEILPIGLLVSLIAALILKRKAGNDSAVAAG